MLCKRILVRPYLSRPHGASTSLPRLVHSNNDHKPCESPEIFDFNRYQYDITPSDPLYAHYRALKSGLSHRKSLGALLPSAKDETGSDGIEGLNSDDPVLGNILAYLKAQENRFDTQEARFDSKIKNMEIRADRRLQDELAKARKTGALELDEVRKTGALESLNLREKLEKVTIDLATLSRVTLPGAQAIARQVLLHNVEKSYGFRDAQQAWFLRRNPGSTMADVPRSLIDFEAFSADSLKKSLRKTLVLLKRHPGANKSRAFFKTAK